MDDNSWAHQRGQLHQTIHKGSLLTRDVGWCNLRCRHSFPAKISLGTSWNTEVEGNGRSICTTNHVRTSWWHTGTLPGHPKYIHFITSKALKQSNCWDTRKRQVWSDHIQVELILPRIGGFCVLIWIQRSSSDCDIQIWNSYTHWIQ